MWVPGLMIVAARVAKPTIPRQLHGDFVRVEEEISKLKVRVFVDLCVRTDGMKPHPCSLFISLQAQGSCVYVVLAPGKRRHQGKAHPRSLSLCLEKQRHPWSRYGWMQPCRWKYFLFRSDTQPRKMFLCFVRRLAPCFMARFSSLCRGIVRTVNHRLLL